MDYDLYWHGDIDALDIYMKKAELENEYFHMKQDQTAWLNGMYHLQAIIDAMSRIKTKGSTSNPCPYPKEPLSMKKVETPEEKADRIYATLKRMSITAKTKKRADDGRTKH